MERCVAKRTIRTAFQVGYARCLMCSSCLKTTKKSHAKSKMHCFLEVSCDFFRCRVVLTSQTVSATRTRTPRQYEPIPLPGSSNYVQREHDNTNRRNAKPRYRTHRTGGISLPGTCMNHRIMECSSSHKKRTMNQRGIFAKEIMMKAMMRTTYCGSTRVGAMVQRAAKNVPGMRIPDDGHNSEIPLVLGIRYCHGNSSTEHLDDGDESNPNNIALKFQSPCGMRLRNYRTMSPKENSTHYAITWDEDYDEYNLHMAPQEVSNRCNEDTVYHIESLEDSGPVGLAFSRCARLFHQPRDIKRIFRHKS